MICKLYCHNHFVDLKLIDVMILSNKLNLVITNFIDHSQHFHKIRQMSLEMYGFFYF